MLGKTLVKIFSVTVFLLGTSLAANAAEGVIKLGVHGAHTGDLAGYGIPSLNAAQLVVNDLNARGGIGGKQVVIVAQDDQCRPDLSTNAASKLISEDVKIVMGPTCSGATKAVMPMYTSKKVIVVSPSATAPDLTQDKKFPYFFRTTPSDDAQARTGVDFSLDVLGAKKVAILHDKGDYGKGYAEFVRQFLKEDGRATEVFFDGITPGQVDYSTVVKKIQRSGADTLVFGGYYPEASKIVSQMKKLGMTTHFVSEDGVKTESFITLADKDSEGVYASSSRDYSDLAMTQKAFADHQKQYNAAPGQFFVQAYAATQALLAAVEKAGGVDDADAIAKILREEYVETSLGKIRFDAIGDMEGSGFSMYRVEGGKFVDKKFEKK